MTSRRPADMVAARRGLLVAVVATAAAAWTIPHAATAAEENPAIATIEAAGGTLVRDDEGRSVEVRFKGPKVDPAVIEGLAGLPGLTSLVVAGTDVGDPLLPAIGRLTTLRNLDLRDCPVTNGGLAHLVGLGNLAALRLSGKSGATTVDDAGLATLAALPSLRTLMLDHLWVSGDGLEKLVPAGRLEELTLAQTLVGDADMEVVARFPRLRRLRLARTSVTAEGLAKLAGLRQLRDLDVSEAVQLDDAALEHVGGLASLAKLNLWRVPVGDAGVAHLAGLTDLEWLNLDNTLVSDTGLESLAGMGKLRSLYLGSTAISNAGLERLASLESLRDLSITRTGVDAAAVEALRRRRPNLTVVVESATAE